MSKILLDSGPSRRSLHRIALFLECAQRYAAAYLIRDASGRLGRRVTTDPLVKGSLVHIGLAHTYAQIRALQRGEDPSAYFDWNDAMDAVALKEGDLGAEHLHLCQKMVLAYREKHQQELNSRKFEILHVEEEFGIDITDEATGKVYQFTQRPDLIWRDQMGLVWIVDHKTAWRMAAETLMRYAPSLQMLCYRYWGPLVWGDRFGGVVVNSLIWGDKVNFEFSRSNVGPAPSMVTRFPQIVIDAERGIERLLAEGRDPLDWPKAASERVCMTPYGPCEAMDVCLWGAKQPSVAAGGTTFDFSGFKKKVVP